jgi:predicted MFS family arabinose efflux permease
MRRRRACAGGTMATEGEAAKIAPVSRGFTGGYRAWLLGVLLFTNVLNFSDRQGIAVLAQGIKQDLGLTDGQMGLVQGLAFALCYSLLALPLARLSEHHNRTRIIAAALAIFGLMVALCSRVHSFTQLLLCRVGVAIGDAGLPPPSSSLVGDHYPVGRRASALSIIWLGAPAGVVAGATLGGALAQAHGWRAAFLALGAPALLVAVLALLTLREPPRGLSDPPGQVRQTPPPMTTVLSFLLGKRSVRHILIGAALAAISMNGIGQFLGQFLIRNFDLTLAGAGRFLALLGGVGMASGLAIGGFGMDWAGRLDKRWYAWGPAAGLALATPAFLAGFQQASLMAAVALLLAGHIVLFFYWTPTIATAQNMVSANMRASAYFLCSLVLSLVGVGLGPTLAGYLSDAYASASFAPGDYLHVCRGGHAAAGAAAPLVQSCAASSAAGIRRALMTLSLTFVWAGLHYFLAGRTLAADLASPFDAARTDTGSAVPVAAPAHTPAS